MTVVDVFNYLNKLYPTDTACDFDNPGLLVGNKDDEVTGILVALDCTNAVADYAIKNDINLIVTHHPVIFNGLKQITNGNVVFKLVKNDINVISMHTNLDMGKGGVNDCLCKALELGSVKKFVGMDGFILRSATCKFQNSATLAKHIKEALNYNVRFTDIDKPIKKVLVCSGSGGDFLSDAVDGRFDALITADVKHNVFIDAENLGFPVFDCGHFATENVVVEPIADLLKKKFKSTKIIPYTNTKIKSI